MGGLAHFIEEEGIPTTQVSLIRLHTEIIKPPRALWVPFELGRPLGVPNDAGFQKRVLMAVLKLLDIPEGPVLEDFLEDAPAAEGRAAALACPVDFSRPEAGSTETDKLCRALQREIRSMQPWYERSLKDSGRTTVGISGIDPENLADFICTFFDDETPATPHPDISPGYALNLAIDDLKAYYAEGLTSQPGQSSPSSKAFSNWFWGETIASKVILRLAQKLGKSENSIMQIVGKVLLVPVDQRHRHKS